MKRYLTSAAYMEILINNNNNNNNNDNNNNNISIIKMYYTFTFDILDNPSYFVTLCKYPYIRIQEQFLAHGNVICGLI